MNSFVDVFPLGLCTGLVVGLSAFWLGRCIRRTFGLVGRAALMR